MFRFSSGYVCSPFGCENAIPTGAFENYPSSPGAVCEDHAMDDDGIPRAQCVPELFRATSGILCFLLEAIE